MKMAQNTGAGCFLLRIRKVVWGGRKIKHKCKFFKKFPTFHFQIIYFLQFSELNPKKCYRYNFWGKKLFFKGEGG